MAGLGEWGCRFWVGIAIGLPVRARSRAGLASTTARSKDRSLRQLLHRMSARLAAAFELKAPHPSPLPEGEGTDRGVWASYTDVKYRAEHKSRKAQKSAPSPSGEGWGEGEKHHKSKSIHACSSPLNRPSVSSPAFDLRARREAEWRDSYGESIERRCSEANRRRCPRMNPERRNPSLSEGRTSGHRPLVPLGRLPKGLAVRAKP